MIKYGFELEGFYESALGFGIPPTAYPVDGFPALVEFRTCGGMALEDAWLAIRKQMLIYPNVNFKVSTFKFKPEVISRLRKLRPFTKQMVDVQNLYGKAPRTKNGVTLASLQINISNELCPEQRTVLDGNYSVQPAKYGLLDIPQIVRRLDNEFRDVIQASGRQMGMYAIKDGVRLEYRSLPNSAFPMYEDDEGINAFLNVIKLCVVGD